MFSRPKILFLVSLLFVALLNLKFNPYLPFKFLIFLSFLFRRHLICDVIQGYLKELKGIYIEPGQALQS